MPECLHPYNVLLRRLQAALQQHLQAAIRSTSRLLNKIMPGGAPGLVLPCHWSSNRSGAAVHCSSAQPCHPSIPALIATGQLQAWAVHRPGSCHCKARPGTISAMAAAHSGKLPGTETPSHHAPYTTHSTVSPTNKINHERSSLLVLRLNWHCM
jgi:hypothetical protein